MAMIFDIETDGLLDTVSKVWLLVMQDTVTKEVFSYSDYDSDLKPLAEGLAKLKDEPIIAGHNVIGYDLVVLKKVLGWEPKQETTINDTWLMSQVLRYKRSHKHGLGGWGEHLGYPKLEWTDWSGYSKGMLEYCIRDVELNTKVYNILVEDTKKLIQNNILFKKGIRVEMEFARIEADIQHKGWLFDMDKAKALYKEMDDTLTSIENQIEPQIGLQLIKTDGTEEKVPVWRRDGYYTAVMCKWFGIEPITGRDQDRLVDGPYCRVEFEPGKMSSDKVLKAYLYTLGWEPDEWNWERDPRSNALVKKSPKLSDTSLDKLGPVGKLISDYNTIKNRRGVLEGWIENASKDGRLHGRMWTVGTPTFRCRHEVVANLPGVDAKYGKEMRSLLIAEPGCVIVGADSAGNQMRGLCHDIGNDDFTNEVINGDVHQRNADTLGVTRKIAKPFLYAFLFGAGDGKLGLILSGSSSTKVGAQARAKFQDSIPGFKELVTSLESQYERSSQMFGKSNAFIKGLDGRLVFVASPHQVLNYRLQTTEGITCKAAIVYLRDKLRERNIPHYFAIHYHDELAVVVPEEYGPEVKELSVEAFTEAPKWFGVMCMNGDAKMGTNYAEVH